MTKKELTKEIVMIMMFMLFVILFNISKVFLIAGLSAMATYFIFYHYFKVKGDD